MTEPTAKQLKGALGFAIAAVKERDARIAELEAAHERKYGSKPKQERRSDLPGWKKDKPGRIVSLCGWNGWG